MNHVVKLNLIIMLMGGATGCATIQSVPSKVKEVVLRQNASDDPLVAGTKVSAGYKAAKRELKNPDETMLKFAEWCEQRGDFLEAKQRYQDILNDNPENVQARLGIARVEFETGRKGESEAILKATAQKHPDNAQVWAQMGRIQTEREQWGAASQSLLKAVSLAPQDQATRYQLGLALARSERYDEALEHLKFSVGESAALYNIGYVLSEAERPEEAKHWFRRALDSHPNERTRSMTARMLADLDGGSNPASGPRIVAGTPPKSRVLAEETSFQAYRETPKNWKVRTAASGHSAATPSAATPQTPDTGQGRVRMDQNVKQASFSSPPKQPTNANSTTPMWRGPGRQPVAPNQSAATVNSASTKAVEPPLWGKQR